MMLKKKNLKQNGKMKKLNKKIIQFAVFVTLSFLYIAIIEIIFGVAVSKIEKKLKDA